MNEALTLFREGGPWMYALLVLATGTPFLAVLLTFAAGSRTRTPGCLWTTLALFPLLVGLVATTSLLGTAAGALELASVESRATLAANGFAQALAPLVAGAAASAFAAACIAFAGGLGSLFGARPGGRFTIHHALLAGLAVVSPLGLAFVGAPVGAAVLALAGAGVFVGALRFVRDPASPDAARSAGTRLLVAAMWTLALLGWTLVLVLWDLVDWMGHGASPAVIGPATALTLVALLGVPVVAVTVAPVVKSVSRWTVVNAVLGTLPFFAVVGVGGLVVGPAMQLRQLTIPPEEAREAALAWAGIEVASVKGVRGDALLPGRVLQLQQGSANLDGEVVEHGALPPGELVVEAPGSLPLSEVVAWLPDLRDRDLLWTFRADGKLRSVRVNIADSPGDAKFAIAAVRESSGAVDLGKLGRRGVEHVVDIATTDGLRAGYRQVEESVPEVQVVWIWMPSNATVSDLIGVAARIPEPEDAYAARNWRRVYRMDAVPVGARDTASGLKSGDLRIEGALTERDVQKVLDRVRPGLVGCYERALTQDPDLSGYVDAKVALAPNGSVNSVELVSTLNNHDVEECLRMKLDRVRFPSTDDDAPASVLIPLRFDLGG